MHWQHLWKKLERRVGSQFKIPFRDDMFFSAHHLSVITPKLNLLIIGAGKSGTTSIHSWLNKHSDIFMSYPVKEPHYFSWNEVSSALGRRTGRKAASVMFRKGMIVGYQNERYFGESSTSYTAGVFYENNPIPERARDYNPQMKLIYSIRNPFSRLLSHVRQDMQAGRLPRTLSTIPEPTLLVHARHSCYGRHMANWLDVFPREQMKVVVMEEFKDDPLPMLNEIASYLGLAKFDGRLTFGKLNVDICKQNPIEEIRLTGQQYDRIFPLISEDIDLLEKNLGRHVRNLWDMSKERWCC